MTREYRTAAAFKQALEQRLRTASTSGVDFARRRQLVVFDRFLARIALATDRSSLPAAAGGRATPARAGAPPAPQPSRSPRAARAAAPVPGPSSAWERAGAGAGGAGGAAPAGGALGAANGADAAAAECSGTVTPPREAGGAAAPHSPTFLMSPPKRSGVGAAHPPSTPAGGSS